MSSWAGFEPAFGSDPTCQSQELRRAGRNRTCYILLPKQAGYRSPTTRGSEAGEVPRLGGSCLRVSLGGFEPPPTSSGGRRSSTELQRGIAYHREESNLRLHVRSVASCPLDHGGLRVPYTGPDVPYQPANTLGHPCRSRRDRTCDSCSSGRRVTDYAKDRCGGVLHNTRQPHGALPTESNRACPYVRQEGIEPPRLSAPHPKCGVST
jgi:hypothetical protein